MALSYAEGRGMMAVDERARKRLHDALERALGSEEAATMMSLVPPVGWADVATKRDLDHLETRIKADMERLARRLVMWTSSMVMVAVGLSFGAARLL
jgi:hypothetical protein